MSQPQVLLCRVPMNLELIPRTLGKWQEYMPDWIAVYYMVPGLNRGRWHCEAAAMLPAVPPWLFAI